MTEAWYQLLTEVNPKEIVMHYLMTHPEEFDDTVILSYDTENPRAWRACWTISLCMEKNDARITPHLNGMIKSLPSLNDGHQRELIKIIKSMILDDEQEGRFFDASLTIWESIRKSSSARRMAFLAMSKVIKKYPELWNDLSHLVSEEYLDTLSPAIRKQVEKEIGQFRI